MIGCLTETTACVVAKPLVIFNQECSFIMISFRTEKCDPNIIVEKLSILDFPDLASNFSRNPKQIGFNSL